MARLSQWMKDNQTDPVLRETVCTTLLQWKQGVMVPLQPPLHSSPSLVQALREQNNIGWTAFIEGRLSTHWASAQQHHFQALHKKNTGHRWVSSLIQKLLDVAWDQWDHWCGINHRHSVSANDTRISTAVEDTLATGPSRLTGRDRHYFSFPERTRALPTSKKEGWLAMWMKLFDGLNYAKNRGEILIARRERSCMPGFEAAPTKGSSHSFKQPQIKLDSHMTTRVVQPLGSMVAQHGWRR